MPNVITPSTAQHVDEARSTPACHSASLDGWVYLPHSSLPKVANSQRRWRSRLADTQGYRPRRLILQALSRRGYGFDQTMAIPLP